METVSILVDSKQIQCDMLTVGEYIHLKGDFGALPEIIYKRTGKLPKYLAEQAFLKLFLLSKKKDIKKNYKCDCGDYHEFVIDPDKIQVDETSELLFDFGQVKLKMRYPYLFEDEDVFEMVNRCIEYVLIDDERIEWETLSESDMNMVIESLSFDNIKEVVNKLTSPDVYIAWPLSCKCGVNRPVAIRGLQNIIKLY